MSTTTAINKLIELINGGFRDGEHTAALFFDLSNAFRRVSVRLFVNKLKHYKFDLNSLRLITSYLTDREQFVDIYGYSTGRVMCCATRFGAGAAALLDLCERPSEQRL